MSKQIKGPWHWDQGDIGADHSVKYCQVFDNEESVIADINDQGDPALGAKRARLIAAAPDLLEALQEIRQMLCGRPDISARLRPLMGFGEKATAKKVQAAIVKATGRQS
jgi:hypothetical protein